MAAQSTGTKRTIPEFFMRHGAGDLAEVNYVWTNNIEMRRRGVAWALFPRNLSQREIEPKEWDKNEIKNGTKNRFQHRIFATDAT